MSNVITETALRLDRTPHEATVCSLGDLFLGSLRQNPSAVALEVDQEIASYGSLGTRAARIAHAIAQHHDQKGPARVGVMSSYTIDCFASVLGILFSGNAYVPLNPSFPADRLAYMIAAAGLTLVVTHSSVLGEVTSAVGGLRSEIKVLVTDKWKVMQVSPAGSEILTTTQVANDLDGVASIEIPTPRGGAYTMFTSGSTGRPKGVEISHVNIVSFVNYMLQRYDLGAQDRFSQMFELTFDLSLFDMFVCWAAGGTLCVIPPQSRMAPAKFIRDKALTVFFCVPSVGSALARLKVLRADAFPSLRLSLFCGEALTTNVAELWTSAAPNSIVENLYGPTEATVACAYYRWNSDSAADCLHGVVPIGRAFPEHDARVVDEKGAEATPGSPGELCIAGPQVAAGYLQNPKLTTERFVNLTFEGETRRYYRTGDLVTKNERGELLFLGRTDFQIKLNGYRIEIGEVEQCIRDAAHSEMVAVLCTMDAEGRVNGLVGFIEKSDADVDSVTAACRRKLPPYMVPARLHVIERMPINFNGKIDRNQLVKLA